MLRRALPLLLAPLALLSACAGEPSVDSTDDDYLKNAEKSGSASQRWVYQGPMPSLESPKVVASLKGHTARVTGLLPANFAGDLPFYASPKALPNGRTEVTVVYPIATGAIDPSTGKAPMAPGSYATLWTVPFTPTNDKATWGGFPFILYHSQRGLAFHGPISSIRNAETGDWEWRLVRGPVSHGCNRMQGEHVVELAHLLGTDMKKTYPNGTSFPRAANVTVTEQWDTYDGTFVDVDYPAMASVQRPTTNAKVYPTWDSNNLPNLVCAHDAQKPLDGTHCDGVGLVQQDLATGELLFETVDEPWIGHACDSNDECDFLADGKRGACLMTGGKGYCTVACEGYCADKAGEAGTFCGVHGNGGRCMAKAAVENDGCADVPGTSAKAKERFVGKSGATKKVATVCSF